MCVGDDVSVKYKREDGCENKGDHGPRGVCVCVFEPFFMNGCVICVSVCYIIGAASKFTVDPLKVLYHFPFSPLNIAGFFCIVCC